MLLKSLFKARIFLLRCLLRPNLFCFPPLTSAANFRAASFPSMAMPSYQKSYKSRHHVSCKRVEWGKMTSVGPVFFKAVQLFRCHFYTYLCVCKHVFMVYTFICICWAGISFVVIVTSTYSGHVSTITSPISCNKCSTYTTVVCFYLSLCKSLSDYGGAAERILNFSQ